MEYNKLFETHTDNDLYLTDVTVADRSLSITTRVKETNPPSDSKQTVSTYTLEFETSEEEMSNALNYIHDQTDVSREGSVRKEFQGKVRYESSQYQGNPPADLDKPSTEYEVLEIEVDPNAIYFNEWGYPAIYLSEGGISPKGDTRDLNNYYMLQNFLNEIIAGVDDPIDDNLLESLSKIEYGDNVKNYITDGDRCRNQGMTSQAFLSYVLAAEWAGIAYLKEKRNQDLIEEQKSGGTIYYFAGRDESVISAVDEFFDIDQTTIDMFDTFYKEIRNLTAHHKSGNVIDAEIEAIKRRVINFIEILDSQQY